MKSLPGLIGWVVVVFVVGAFGAVASIEASSFYAGLVRPSWAPPPSVFGPVWTVLYAMMAVSAWLVWKRGGFAAARGALSLFLVQLVANGLWSWLFFAWKWGGVAFADILILWALLLATVIAFWRQRVAAGALLLPYLLWVSFAACLNFSVWRLNPGML